MFIPKINKAAMIERLKDVDRHSVWGETIFNELQRNDEIRIELMIHELKEAYFESPAVMSKILGFDMREVMGMVVR